MTTLLLFFLSGLFGVSFTVPRQFYFVNSPMTWAEAQSYCRAKYTDLVSVHNMEDMDKVKKAVGLKYQDWMWIGLIKNATNIEDFDWSDQADSSFRFWGNGDPDQNPLYRCVTVNPLESWRWNDRFCNWFIPFVCSHDEGKITTLRVKIKCNECKNLNETTVNQIKSVVNNQAGFKGNMIKWLTQADGKVFHKG
ncbi:macrophage mannose receptor 1-like [Xyrauchen texanus]|uniref:macrophage mannose receptor 1-like n=1 Tax=Xyrauchen texanus TaxID=154827 RepID=UPI00224275F0|nr:macrophage mannose receptor 1-like [Xyrauchen texanus]